MTSIKIEVEVLLLSTVPNSGRVNSIVAGSNNKNNQCKNSTIEISTSCKSTVIFLLSSKDISTSKSLVVLTKKIEVKN